MEAPTFTITIRPINHKYYLIISGSDKVHCQWIYNMLQNSTVCRMTSYVSTAPSRKNFKFLQNHNGVAIDLRETKHNESDTKDPAISMVRVFGKILNDLTRQFTIIVDYSDLKNLMKESTFTPNPELDRQMTLLDMFSSQVREFQRQVERINLSYENALYESFHSADW